MLLREHEPLAPRTTLGVGGPARFYLEAASEPEVAEALAWARARSLPTLVLGGGSNLLVSDRGFDGLVLFGGSAPKPPPGVREGGACGAAWVSRAVEDRDGVVEVEVGAGERWDDFVAEAVARDWAGVECLSGIPGSVGATPIQNVGAYGQEVAETIVKVRAVERATGEVVTLDAARCGFGYRDSVFKREDKDRFVITSVRFALRKGGAAGVRYAELAKKLAAHVRPTLAVVRETVIELRRGKSMVLDPSDENGRSAGSFFMNPTVAAAEADRLAEALGGEMPRYAAAGGQVKLSAAWLIERAGFRKGTHEGAVGISTRHSLAIVNRGGATAAEVVAFARRVRDGVRERCGVTLTPEPVLVGFGAEETAALV